MDYWLDLFTWETWNEFKKAGGKVSGFREQRWRPPWAGRRHHCATSRPPLPAEQAAIGWRGRSLEGPRAGSGLSKERDRPSDPAAPQVEEVPAGRGPASSTRPHPAMAPAQMARPPHPRTPCQRQHPGRRFSNPKSGLGDLEIRLSEYPVSTQNWQQGGIFAKPVLLQRASLVGRVGLEPTTR